MQISVEATLLVFLFASDRQQIIDPKTCLGLYLFLEVCVAGQLGLGLGLGQLNQFLVGQTRGMQDGTRQRDGTV